MARPHIDPIRWSAWMASQEFGKTINNIKAGIRANNIQQGEDGKYSSRQILLAIAGTSGLKSSATDARYQEQIDKAELMSRKLALSQKELMPTAEVRQAYEDIQTKLVQMIRHSKLSQQQKDILFRQIGELKVAE